MSPKSGECSTGGRRRNSESGELGVVDQQPTYDPTTDAYWTTFSPTDTAASVAVVAAMAEVRRCSTTDLEPFYDAVDTDALDALVDAAGPSLEVRFSLDGFGILVTGTGRIEVTPPE